MKKNYNDMLLVSQDRAVKALLLLKASLTKYEPYDVKRLYTPDDLEYYDALSDRFIRVIERSISFFRTYELYLFAESSSVLRDILNKMAKVEFISEVELWFRMRDVRNRIVHQYLPEEIKEIYSDIKEIFWNELENLLLKLNSINTK